MKKTQIGNNKRIAVFGASSGIATAVCKQLASSGSQFILVGRDGKANDERASDLRVRGASGVASITADFAAIELLEKVVTEAWATFGGIDLAFIAYGSLPDQQRTERDSTLIGEALGLNFVSPAVLANLLALKFEAQGHGHLAVITSVAGDRGRKSNYIYGSAKAGLQQLLGGLRHRLYNAGVFVLDIRPGFVSTRMTAHLPQGFLWATPDRVAADIISGIAKRSTIIYTPWFWRVIMALVRGLPNFVFHRSSL